MTEPQPTYHAEQDTAAAADAVKRTNIETEAVQLKRAIMLVSDLALSLISLTNDYWDDMTEAERERRVDMLRDLRHRLDALLCV
jgi:hypothetical protein